MAQKNFKKIPVDVLERVGKIAIDDIVVACVKRVDAADLINYAHLGLGLRDGALVVPPPTPPPPAGGKYSDANVNGKEIVRKDLPKVTKTFAMEAPNWRGSGTHTVFQSRDVYARDFLAPKELNLSVEVLATEPDGSRFTLKFAIDEVIRRGSPQFDTDLLFALNLLQEAVGAADVFPSVATLADYTATLRLDWEILPPGDVDEVLRQMLQGKRPVPAEKQRVMRARLAVMARLRPQRYVAGSSEFLRYFGAQFEDDFVAFENLNYGNALYVMYQNWEELSRRSRTDLLTGPREGFERIPHAGKWADQLGYLLREHRRARRA